MGCCVRTSMRRRPLVSGPGVITAVCFTLINFSIVASGAPSVQPPASAADQSRTAPMAGRHPLHVWPYIDSTPARRHFPASGESVAEPSTRGSLAARPVPFALPASRIEAQIQTLFPSGNQLPSYPVGQGRISLMWQHGAGVGANLHFDDSATRPAVELTDAGTRNIKLSVVLHW